MLNQILNKCFFSYFCIVSWKKNFCKFYALCFYAFFRSLVIAKIFTDMEETSFKEGQIQKCWTRILTLGLIIEKKPKTSTCSEMEDSVIQLFCSTLYTTALRTVHLHSTFLYHQIQELILVYFSEHSRKTRHACAAR